MIQQFTSEFRIYFITDIGLIRVNDEFDKNIKIHELLMHVKLHFCADRLWLKMLQSTFHYHKIISCYIKISEQIFLKV